MAVCFCAVQVSIKSFCTSRVCGVRMHFVCVLVLINASFYFTHALMQINNFFVF